MNMTKNPNYNKFKKPDDYVDLGWQLSPDNEHVKLCISKGHNNRGNPIHWREFDNSLYEHRCTDVITICDECKIIWHTDMSD